MLDVFSGLTTSKKRESVELITNFVVCPGRVNSCLMEASNTVLDKLCESDLNISNEEVDEIIRTIRRFYDCYALETCSIDSLARIKLNTIHNGTYSLSDGIPEKAYDGAFVILRSHGESFLVDGNHRFNTFINCAPADQLVCVVFIDVELSEKVMKCLRK